jgi:NAD(P)-dependent dehydrogenase (short-subunit alcohol dehydrogenase family)
MLLQASVPSRIVIVSSGLHKYGKIDFDNLDGSKAYNAAAAYNNSKLANNLFARELSRRTAGSGIGIYCLRPGVVRTELGRHMKFNFILRAMAQPLIWLLMRSPFEGCQTVMHCILAEELDGATGHFYANCAVEEWSEPSKNDDVALQLWQVSEKLTGIASSSPPLKDVEHVR